MHHTTRLPWLSERLRSIVTVHAHTLGRTGTGFVVRADGHLLTAAHCVVDDSGVPFGDKHETEEDITVAFHDGGTYSVQLVGFDMHADVAVLRLPPDAPVLSPIPVRRHTYPQPGDTCVVVGNIFGQDPRSVAVGAVRNGRWKDPYGLSLLSTVLTDVATGAGTSGGPILDATGHVVALHAAAYGASPQVCTSCGLAFRSADDLMAHWESPCKVGSDEDAYKTVTVDTTGSRTTQLGGGLASPMLWRVYHTILHQDPPGDAMVYTIRKLTLPCITIPCVVGNVARIRLALEDPVWCPHPGANGAFVVVQPTGNSTLEPGDLVLTVDGVRVAGASTPTPHDVTWLRTPGTPCPVQVLRGGSPVDLSVETTALDHMGDVSVGELQSGIYTLIWGSFGSIGIRVDRGLLRVKRIGDTVYPKKKMTVQLYSLKPKQIPPFWERVDYTYIVEVEHSTTVDGTVPLSKTINLPRYRRLWDLLYKIVYDHHHDKSPGPWDFELY